MRSRLLLLAALGAGTLVGGPLIHAAVNGTLVPQAHAQAAPDETGDEAARRQEDFQRARIEGNRLVLRGSNAGAAEGAAGEAAAGEAAAGEAAAGEAAAGEAAAGEAGAGEAGAGEAGAGEAGAGEAAADESAADEAVVANERADAVAGADAAAADEAQAGAGVAAAGEVEGNAGAEVESNAGAEAESNAGAEAEGAAVADQAADAAAEADADARLAEREAAALRAVDRAAAEEEATEPAEVDDLAGGGFGVAPGDAAAGRTDLGDAATVAEELAEEGDAAVAAAAADAAAAAAGADAAAARGEAAALAAEEPLPAGEAPELATETPVQGEPALTAEAPAEEPTAEQLTPAQQRAAAARAAAEERARRMNEVAGAVNQLNSNQQALDERTVDLQEEQDALRDRGTGLEGARVARVAAYDAAMAQLLDVADFLSTGGGTGADAQLAALSASLGELAQNAFQTSGEEEANRVLTAQETVEASRATLAQADPFGARMYLRATMDELTAARALAESYAEPLFREE